MITRISHSCPVLVSSNLNVSKQEVLEKNCPLGRRILWRGNVKISGNITQNPIRIRRLFARTVVQVRKKNRALGLSVLPTPAYSDGEKADHARIMDGK
jgi:hypothetical protein